MAFAHVQDTTAHSVASFMTLSIGTVGAGNLLVIGICATQGVNPFPMSGNGNTYTQIASTVNDATAGFDSSFAYVQNANSGATTITLANFLTNVTMIVMEFSGAATSGALDANPAGRLTTTSTGGNGCNTTAWTPGAAGKLKVAVISCTTGLAPTWTAGTIPEGYTAGANELGVAGTGNTFSEYILSGASGSHVASFGGGTSGSDDYVAFAASFNPFVASGGVPGAVNLDRVEQRARYLTPTAGLPYHAIVTNPDPPIILRSNTVT